MRRIWHVTVLSLLLVVSLTLVSFLPAIAVASPVPGPEVSMIEHYLGGGLGVDPINPLGITTGPDGALWFTESGVNRIGRVTTSGKVVEYDVPTPDSTPVYITTGSDGALWFTENSGNKIGRVTTAGAFLEYAVPTTKSGPNGITTGSDGALWFTEWSTLGRANNGRTITPES